MLSGNLVRGNLKLYALFALILTKFPLTLFLYIFFKRFSLYHSLVLNVLNKLVMKRGV